MTGEPLDLEAVKARAGRLYERERVELKPIKRFGTCDGCSEGTTLVWEESGSEAWLCVQCGIDSALPMEVAADQLCLCDELSRLREQEANRVNLLGQALGELLVALGVVSNVGLTGPQLLVAAKDAVEFGGGIGDAPLEDPSSFRDGADRDVGLPVYEVRP